MVPHVGLGAVQEPLELETIRVPVGDDVADLADDGREYEDADQVADYREDVPANQEGRKRADQSEGGVISVLRSWTSGPRRSLPPLSLFIFSLLSYLPSLRSFVPFFRSLSYTFSHSLSLTLSPPLFLSLTHSLSFSSLSFSRSLSFSLFLAHSVTLSVSRSLTAVQSHTNKHRHTCSQTYTSACGQPALSYPPLDPR